MTDKPRVDIITRRNFMKGAVWTAATVGLSAGAGAIASQHGHREGQTAGQSIASTSEANAKHHQAVAETAVAQANDSLKIASTAEALVNDSQRQSLSLSSEIANLQTEIAKLESSKLALTGDFSGALEVVRNLKLQLERQRLLYNSTVNFFQANKFNTHTSEYIAPDEVQRIMGLMPAIAFRNTMKVIVETYSGNESRFTGIISEFLGHEDRVAVILTCRHFFIDTNKSYPLNTLDYLKKITLRQNPSSYAENIYTSAFVVPHST